MEPKRLQLPLRLSIVITVGVFLHGSYCISRLGVQALSISSSERYRQKLRPLAQRTSGGRTPLDVELDLWKSGYKFIIGSDDSGAGCIAGPIATVSLCILGNDATIEAVPGVADSKLLSKADRERIYQHICANPQIYLWTYAMRSNEDIDSSTLDKVTMDCFRESIETLVEKLKKSTSYSSSSDDCIYSIVDGNRSPAKLSIASRPWVKADVSVYSVALASILARVVRDQLMEQAALAFPNYGFANHGGYPTAEHIQSLHQWGPSPLHRQSTKPVQQSRGLQLPRDQFLLALLTTSVSFTLFGFQQRSSATTIDPRTGIALPDQGEIEAAVPRDWTDVENPIADREAASLLTRLDSSDDAIFYADPRFVEHVDEQAVGLLTNYVSKVAIQSDTSAVLDLCSSWTSHIVRPPSLSLERVAGLGMNAKELQNNPSLTEYVVRDLNAHPTLPYNDNSFDVVLCQLSIDYLTKPLQVCREIGRVLKPGGTLHVLFSNRLFLSKAVALWTGADDIDHTYIVACYLHFCQGGFTNIQARDLSVRKQGRDRRIVGDPLYVVTGTKQL